MLVVTIDKQDLLELRCRILFIALPDMMIVTEPRRWSVVHHQKPLRLIYQHTQAVLNLIILPAQNLNLVVILNRPAPLLH